MKIYNYNSITGEYIGESIADLDPEESKIQGKDVYLIPAYSTTVKPPSVTEKEVVIFENGGWTIVPDYRGMYMVNRNMQPEKVEKLGYLPLGYIAITNEQAEQIQQDKDYYIIQDGELIENPNYQQIKYQQRERQFNLQFFQTSLGYVRRTVTMKDGTTKDFLTDLFTPIVTATNAGQIVQIFTYDKPDFNEDVTNWERYQHKVSVTSQFIQECFLQLSIDFFG